MRRALAAAVLLLAQAPLSAAPGAERFVESRKLPSGQVAVVAEGDLEPRSIGSYSLRLYSGRSPEFPVDDFVAGVIRPRDGTVFKVLLADVDGNAPPEIVIVMQSAGSGGYLSADAFRYGRHSLSRVASVSGLAPGADPVAALRKTRATAPRR